LDDKKGGGLMERQFFGMPLGDKIALIIILIYSVLTFFFVNSTIKISGVSIFGWLIGLLMFLAPIVHLLGMQFDEQKYSKTNSKGVGK
jgi:hypothetical protein